MNTNRSWKTKMKSFSTVATQQRKMTKIDLLIKKQAEKLIQDNSYFRDHQDENVFIHWKHGQPYVLPNKMTGKEAKQQGFETMINTVRLSSILNGTARIST